MNILYIVLAFIGILIILYILLAIFFFGRNYKIKSDKIFSDAVKAVLEDLQDSKNMISIKELSKRNSNFKYLNGKSQSELDKDE